MWSCATVSTPRYGMSTGTGSWSQPAALPRGKTPYPSHTLAFDTETSSHLPSSASSSAYTVLPGGCEIDGCSVT